MSLMPNINGMRAKPYITWHLNWQTRLNKERMVAMPPEMSEDAMRHPSALLKHVETKGGFPLPIGPEACPIGGAHSRNNASKEFARTFGPASWKTSGGLTSNTHATFGDLRKKGHPGDALRMSLQKAGRTAPPQPRRSESSPAIGDTFVLAECMRAAPNRSVASILRQGEAGMPEYHHHRRHHASSASRSEASHESYDEGLLAEDLAAGAACMRAAPNRSVASILRAGEAGLPEHSRRRAASSSGSCRSHSQVSTPASRHHHSRRGHQSAHGLYLGDRSVEDDMAAANCMRAAPNRSVASILREAAAHDG